MKASNPLLMLIAKVSTPDSAPDLLTVSGLAVGAVSSVISQQLVYFLAPFPVLWGINEVERRRLKSEQLTRSHHPAVISTVQQKPAPSQTSPSFTALQQRLEEERRQKAEFQQQAAELIQSIESLTKNCSQAEQKVRELELRLFADVDKRSLGLESPQIELNETSAKLYEAIALRELAFEANQDLEDKARQLNRELEATHQRVLHLETELQFYKYRVHLTETLEIESSYVEKEVLETTDLSALNIALVGGHENTRREVINELLQNYGLQNYVEIPPRCEANISRKKVQTKLSRCNLVTVITGYMDHSLNGIVDDLHKDGAFMGEVLRLPTACHGKSGVVREILNYVRASESTKLAMPSQSRAEIL